MAAARAAAIERLARSRAAKALRATSRKTGASKASMRLSWIPPQAGGGEAVVVETDAPMKVDAPAAPVRGAWARSGLGSQRSRVTSCGPRC